MVNRFIFRIQKEEERDKEWDEDKSNIKYEYIII